MSDLLVGAARTAVHRAWCIAATAVCVVAQLPPVHRAPVPPFDPVAECPFDTPRLDSRSWEHVAWASEQLAAKPGDIAAAVVELRRALGRARADDSPTARRALPHLLYALQVLSAVVPAAELDLPSAPGVRAPLACLLTRATDADALLFRLFRASTDDTPEWEVLGAALALRRHRAFAAELFASLRPVLHVQVEPDRAAGTYEVLDVQAPADARDGFPPAPAWTWRRNGMHLLELEVGPRTAVASVHPTPPLKSMTERARLRWLAYLAREADPVQFARRFELSLPVRDVPNAQARVALAKERAEAGLRSVTAALVEQGLIPAPWAARVPNLRLEVHDYRLPSQCEAMPLPELK